MPPFPLSTSRPDRNLARSRWCWPWFSLLLFLAAAGHSTTAPHPMRGEGNYDLHIPLSESEKDYLASLPTLRLGLDADWMPFSFMDDSGHPGGISADYLAYIQQSLHITMQRVPSDSWQQTLDLAAAGQVDIIAAFSQTNAPHTSFLLSHAYIDYPSVIVTREDAPYIGGLDDLAGSRVAIIQGSDFGLRPLPAGLRTVPVASASEGMAQVAQGSSFAYVDNLGVVERLIKNRYTGVLRVAAPTAYSESLHFGVAPAYAPLVPLIDRVLDAIPTEEKERIKNTWLSTRLQYALPSRTLWGVLVPIGLVTLGFIVVLVVIIGYLRREIRQRRRAESELRFQSQFQQMLMDTVPIPIFVKDLDNRYLAVNPAYEETVGVKARDLVGKTAVQAAHIEPADSDRFNEISLQVIATGEPAHGQTQYRTRNGELRDAVYWLRLCYADDDAPRAVLGASIDTTELRAVERRELDLKRQLEELTMVLPAVTFQLRYTRGHGITPLFVSEYAGTLTGIPAAVLLDAPQRFADLLGTDEQRRLRRVLLRAVRHRTTGKIEFPLAYGPGDVAWVRMELVSRRVGDGRYTISGYLIDVTQARMQTLSLAQAKREAEDASQIKDTFLATMSHEIRTPMSGVIGVLDLMNRADLHPNDQHLLDMARSAAAALMRILNGILDFSRNQQGELAVESAPLSVRDVVDGVTGLFAPEIHRKALRFDVLVRSDVALRHIGDAHRIGQILLNLVSNALKFTDAGSVGITVETDDGGIEGEAQRLYFRVKDSGIGIDPERQRQLFTPFIQADSSTSRRYGGTGLGLAICKQLADAMGGHIDLQSIPGLGTEITVELPLAVGTPPRRPPRRDAWLPLGDEIVREALREHLSALNVRILAANELALPSTDPVLVFRDAKLAVPEIARPLIVIDISRDLVGADAGHPGKSYRLCVNPLRWGDVEDACRLIDGTDSERPTEGSMDVPPLPAIPTTDRVLLVEDQPLNQELLLRQMEALQVETCDMADNGAEALQALSQRHYPLVITDCAMPIMGGVELIRRIRMSERGGPLRSYIAALTANASDHQREQCLAAGADEVLVKPIDTRQLGELLQRACLHAGPSEKSLASPPGIPSEQVPALLLKLKQSIEEDMQAVRDAIAQEQLARAKEATHRILGAARWFQLMDIVDAAQALENDLDEGRTHQVALQSLTLAVKAFVS